MAISDVPDDCAACRMTPSFCHTCDEFAACVHTMFALAWHDFWCQVAICGILSAFKESIDYEYGESSPKGFIEWIGRDAVCPPPVGYE